MFEFTRWISDDVHRLGKLMFANGVPYRFTSRAAQSSASVVSD